MSPEQIEDASSIDGRSDIYSLGVVVYQMLTCEVPFKGKNTIEVLNKHLEKIPLPPSRRNDGISEELNYVVLRALAKDRELRYQTADDFKMALLNAVNDPSIIQNDSREVAKSIKKRPYGKIAKLFNKKWHWGLLILFILLCTILILNGLQTWRVENQEATSYKTDKKHQKGKEWTRRGAGE